MNDEVKTIVEKIRGVGQHLTFEGEYVADFIERMDKIIDVKGVQLEAYSPLARAEKLDDPNIIKIAKNYSKTPAQIMIRWALQHDLVVIPKTVHKDRIFENADVFDFEISEEDMERMNSLNEEFRIAWDPTNVD